MATMAQLRYAPLSGYLRHLSVNRDITNLSLRSVDNSFPNTLLTPSLKINPTKIPSNGFQSNFRLFCSAAGSENISTGHGGGGGGGGSDYGGGGGHGGGGGDSDKSGSSWDNFGPIGAFITGWRSRVAADAQFPFKVLMEELVGVSACVLGDMASRPNFGLNELDFVFSTLVVGSILNFTLMYLLAPILSVSSQTLPGLFANSPTSHMFEPGPYSLVNRLGTFVYKGTVFAAVGFAAGLVGTALSNGLIKMRKKMDPDFETPNKPPPTVLNAMTWALHMGISSNFRYQTLNGIEFLLAKGFPPFLFKTSVVVLRCMNNIIGGMSFVVLARLTGSQSVGGEKNASGGVDEVRLVEEKQKLVNEVIDANLQPTHSESASSK